MGLDPKPVRSAPREEHGWMAPASARVATVESVAKCKRARWAVAAMGTATKKQLVAPRANANVVGPVWGAGSSRARTIRWQRRSCPGVGTKKNGVYARRASVSAPRSGEASTAPNPLAKIVMMIKRMGPRGKTPQWRSNKWLIIPRWVILVGSRQGTWTR